MKHELIKVDLSNGDSVVYLNGVKIVHQGGNDVPDSESAMDILFNLAEALNCSYEIHQMDVPSDSDWNWDDVYELLPARPTPVSESDSVPVKYWDHYDDSTLPMTHQIDITDQRESNGQLFVDVGVQDGDLDEMICVALEVNRNPLTNKDDVPCAHVSFDGDNMAFSMFKIGDRILIRPETDVRFESFRGICGSGSTESLIWVE